MLGCLMSHSALGWGEHLTHDGDIGHSGLSGSDQRLERLGQHEEKDTVNTNTGQVTERGAW